MSYLNRILKLIISIESIIISSLTQINIPLPLIDNFNNVSEFQVNLQIPVIILLTIIFSGELIFKAYFLYILLAGSVGQGVATNNSLKKQKSQTKMKLLLMYL